MYNYRIKKYAWVIFLLIVLSQLFMSIGPYTYGPLAPFLTDTLNFNRTQIGSLVSLFYLAGAITATPSGLLVDKWTAHKMLVISLLTEGISFIGMSFTESYVILLIFAAIGGAGYGMINQVSIKGIVSWFPNRLRATLMGLKQAQVTIAGAVTGIIIPSIAISYGWSSAFLIVGIIISVMGTISYCLYKEAPICEVTGKQNDIKMYLLLKETLNPNLLRVVVMTPFMAFNQGALSTFLVLYLREIMDYSFKDAGLCLTAAMIAGTLGRIVWGFISDRYFKGNRLKPAVILSAISAIGAFGFAIMPSGTPILVGGGLSIICGATMIGWNALLIVLFSELGGEGREGSAVGIGLTTNSLGIFLGPILFGYIADHMGYLIGWLIIMINSILSAMGYLYVNLHLQNVKVKDSPYS